MNSITQKQLTNTAFNCSFCNYQSNLNLKECPGCGRVERVSKPTINQSGKAIELQIQEQVNIGSKAQSTFTTQVAENCVYKCRRCYYQTRKSFRECPECGRLDSAEIVFLAPESNVDKAKNQNFQKKRKLSQTTYPLIFENSHIFNAVIFSILFLVCGAAVLQTTIIIILLFLIGTAMFSLYILKFYCLYVAVSQDGVAQKHLFGGWEVSWSQITGWNEFAAGEGGRSICFRTGANVYKISPDILSKHSRFELVKERFEDNCGMPLEKSNRVGGIWW